MKKILALLLLISILTSGKLFAQENRFSGWAALFHTQKFSDKWGMSLRLLAEHTVAPIGKLLLR
jgi:hypothetical protein